MAVAVLAVGLIPTLISVFTVPEDTGNKSARVPKDTDIVAEIYVDGAEEPYKTIQRSEFAYQFTHRGDTNIFRTDENLYEKDIRIEIRYDIDIGADELCIVTSPEHTVTVNGNGNKITGSDTSNPVLRVQSCSRGGNVVFHRMDLENTKASCFQYYNEVTVDINDCEWTAKTHKVLLLTSSGTVNVNNRSVFRGYQPIYAQSTTENTVNIANGAEIIGSLDAITVKKGPVTFNVKGEVRSSCAGGRAFFAEAAAENVTVNVDGGIFKGDISADSGTTLNLMSGRLAGLLLCDNATVNQSEYFMIG